MEEQQPWNLERVTLRCARCDARRPGSVPPAFAVLLYGVPPAELQHQAWYEGKPAETEPCWSLAWVHHRSVRSAVAAKVVLNGGALDRYQTQGRRRIDPVAPEGFGEFYPLTRRSVSVAVGPCRVCKASPRVRVGTILDRCTSALSAGGENLYL